LPVTKTPRHPKTRNVTVGENNNWRATVALKAAFTSIGAFALATDNSLDAALAIELPPGAYTATVSGKQNTTGVALVEVYELP
jgi:inosine/xanthosine triphosphate pyrophosphatase family protein